MVAALLTGSALRRLAQYAVAGTAGNLIVRGAERVRPHAGPVARRATVRLIAAGIVGGRKLGDAAEEARLQAGDLLAEAQASLGETAPAPGAATPASETPTPATVANATKPAARKATPGRATPRKAAPRKRTNNDHGHEH